MIDFNILHGLSTELFSAPEVVNPDLIIEEGCWYLCTDTAELYLGVKNDTTGEFALKKINHAEEAIDPSVIELLNVEINKVKESLNDYAKKTDLPDVSNFITEAEVGAKGYLTAQDINNKAEKEHTHTLAEITDYEAPDFTGYATEEYVDGQIAGIKIPSLEGYAKTSDIPTNVSQLNNDAGYITDISSKADVNHKHDDLYDAKGAAEAVKNELLNGAGDAYNTLKELGELIDGNQDAIDALEKVAAGKADKEHVHSYNDLTDKPEIPTKVSELENDAEYATEASVTQTKDGLLGLILTAIGVSDGPVQASDMDDFVDQLLTKFIVQAPQAQILNSGGGYLNYYSFNGTSCGITSYKQISNGQIVELNKQFYEDGSTHITADYIYILYNNTLYEVRTLAELKNFISKHLTGDIVEKLDAVRGRFIQATSLEELTDEEKDILLDVCRSRGAHKYHLYINGALVTGVNVEETFNAGIRGYKMCLYLCTSADGDGVLSTSWVEIDFSASSETNETFGVTTYVPGGISSFILHTEQLNNLPSSSLSILLTLLGKEDFSDVVATVEEEFAYKLFNSGMCICGTEEDTVFDFTQYNIDSYYYITPEGVFNNLSEDAEFTPVEFTISPGNVFIYNNNTLYYFKDIYAIRSAVGTVLSDYLNINLVTVEDVNQAIEAAVEVKANDIPFNTDKFVTSAIGGFEVGENVKGYTVSQLFAKLLGLTSDPGENPDEPEAPGDDATPEEILDYLTEKNASIYVYDESDQLVQEPFTEPVAWTSSEASVRMDGVSTKYTIKDGDTVVEAGYQQATTYSDTYWLTVALPSEINNIKVKMYDPDVPGWIEPDNWHMIKAPEQTIPGYTIWTVPEEAMIDGGATYRFVISN